MKNNYKNLYRTVTFIGIASILAGCGTTQKSRLYVLHAPTADSMNQPTDRSSVIMVSPIEVPAYLDRPTIVTQANDHELTFSEFHRWAGPIEKNVQQTVVQNLSSQLESSLVVTDARSIKPSYRVKIYIGALTGTLGKTATLQAQWTLYSENQDQVVLTKNFQKSIALADDDHIAYVAAQSELLGELSRSISDSIRQGNHL